MSQTTAQLISNLVQALAFESTSSAPDNGVYLSAANTLAFNTNAAGSPRLTIDSSGRLLVGTSSDSKDSSLVLQGNSGLSTAAGVIRLARGTSTPANADDLGFIFFGDNSHGSAASIKAQRDGGTWTSGSSEPARLVFSTTADGASSPTERMRISANGNLTVDTDTFFVDAVNNRVGIGTTAPGEKLHISGGANDRIVVSGSGSSGLLFQNTSGTNLFQIVYDDASTDDCFITTSHDLVFRNQEGTQGGTITERARIDSDGRLLVGTSSDVSGDSTNTSVQIVGGVDNTYGALHLCRNDSTIASSNPIGRIEFRSNDENGTYESHARIEVQAEGGIGDGDKPGRMIFYTTPDASATPEERMRIASNGDLTVDTDTFFVDAVNNRVGVGTTTPGTGTSTNGNQLVIANAGSASSRGGISIFNGNTGLGSIYFADTDSSTVCAIQYDHSENALDFRVNDNNRARIDSDGRLLVGTSSAVTGGTSQFSRIVALGNSAGATNPGVISVGMGATPASGNNIGRIFFVDNAAGEYAEIAAQCDGTPGSGDYPGRLVFSTTADAQSSPTERMRIDSNGRLFVPGVWDFSTSGGTTVVVTSDDQIRKAASSIRYKTDVEDLEDAYADQILNIRPVWYRSLCDGDDPTHGYWGFIAEEVAEIDPRLTTWKFHDISYDENGSRVVTKLDTPEPEGVAYDRFVPHLLNLIKRQKEHIEAMEARLSALEAQ